MIVLPEPLLFEWDQGNIEKNKVKHNVTPEEAEEVFQDDKNFILVAKQKSGEKRYMLWGQTSQRRLLTIIFTIREDKVRIISARPINKKERSTYEQKIKTRSDI